MNTGCLRTVLGLADHARGPPFAADHRDRFDFYFFPYSHSVHTGLDFDWIEVKVAMIKERETGQPLHSRASEQLLGVRAGEAVQRRAERRVREVPAGDASTPRLGWRLRAT